MKEDNTPINVTWLANTGGYARDMTLRDHFAGLAFQIRFAKYDDWTLTEMTEQAYADADAMLKAKNKT
jgi:hypothetical protein